MNASLPRALEIEAFVPAKNFQRSKQFYEALGIACEFVTGDLTGMRPCCQRKFTLFDPSGVLWRIAQPAVS